ncbi:MAG TPA: monofunctional biosynthetic peptidoglycan transglycosylase [Sphingobium sp.]
MTAGTCRDNSMAMVQKKRTSSSRGSNPRGSTGGRIVRFLFRAVVGFVALSLFFVVLYRFVPVPVTWTMIFDSNGITKDWTALSDIDPDMPRAAIAAEDSKFCQHHGFDVGAISKAFEHNEKGGRIRGGSTISQQTAKNVFLWQGGGYFRKGLEAYFTLLIEAIWGKRRIMEVYLNVAETGIGTYGVEAGAMRYFNHGAGKLSTTEAGRLAAILPLPKKRAAISPKGFTRRYGNIIARRIGSVRQQGLDACLK